MFRSSRDVVRIPKKSTNSTHEIYNCDMCDRGGWHSENDVEIHKKEIHYLQSQKCRAKHKDRFCTVCMTLLDTNEDLIEHIKTQHLLSSPRAQRVEREIYICNECTHIFFNKDVLATHMLYVHLVKKCDRRDKYFSCPKCNKKCLIKSIWFHFQKHDMPSVSMCDICLVNFPSRAALYEHVENHKGYFKCEPCGYNSTQLAAFEVHLQEHVHRKLPHGKVSPQVLSTVFKKHKNCFVRYNVHNTLKGLNLPRFMDICTLCREICVSHRESKRHVLRDHMYDELEKKKKHLCSCGEEFCYKVVLKQHVMKTKGHHQPVENTSEQAFAQLLPTANDKADTQLRMSLKSLLKYNKIVAAHHSSENQGVVYGQNEGVMITDEAMESDLILINEDAHTVTKVDMGLSNKIEIEISKQLIDHMDYEDK